jgi:polyhydroxyalkanoate synthesis regulator phasin
MPQSPDWKRYLEAGMQVTEFRRSQAQALARDLVGQGQLAREQVATAVEEMLAMSRRRTEQLQHLVRKEVQRQLASLGLATQADLRRLEQKLNEAVKKASKQAAKRATKTSSKATAKKASAKKAG